MNKLSTQAYKGTRDYYPSDKRLQNYIFSVWKKVTESFGYEEYGAPTIEPLELYAAKSGQEIVNEQTYTFTDRGGRIVAVRPEMTPSISRMVAARRQELAYPARLYSIANFMRYERPQHGREREFWQLNVDIFGADGVMAEAEIIQIADKIMKGFGAKNDDYVIKINNRKLINFVMAQYLELDVDQAHMMIKLFDRMNKISKENFDNQAIEIFDGDGEVGLSKINKLLNANNMSELPTEILESSAVREIQALFTILEHADIESLVFDITLMRGFDYYTGMVFEVFDRHPDNNRALFGGGRYDGLVGLFGVEPISAVGFAPGGTMMECFLKTHNLVPKSRSTTDVYVVILNGLSREINKLVSDLRDSDVNVELEIITRKLDKQIKTALKKEIPYILFIGEEEVKSGIYALKDVANNTDYKLGFDDIVNKIKEK